MGEDGKTHHGAFDLSYLRCLPNLILSAPKDENEAQHLLYTGYRSGQPFAIRIARGTGVGTPIDSVLREITIGTGELLEEGSDVAIVALGKCVPAAIEASHLLANQGVSCAVVNGRLVKPIDQKLIARMARHTGRILTVEENVLAGGFGTAVLEALNAAKVRDVEVERLGMPDEFVEHASQANQRRSLRLDAQGIVDVVLERFSPSPISHVEPEPIQVRS